MVLRTQLELPTRHALRASLARLEARIGFEALFKRVSKFGALKGEVEFIDSFLLRGPKQLLLSAERV